jgi:RNA polymerase sigma-70 factor (ECF subfamily)
MPSATAKLLRLHTAYAAGVYRFLCSLTQDAGAAQDLLQEVFIKLARDLTGVLAAESEQAWIFKLARNVAIDWLRRNRVRQDGVEALGEVSEAFVLPTDPDAAAIQTQLTSQLAALSEDQRAAVHLHLWQGLTFKEIAAIQDVALATAASRYRYGIMALRAALHPIYTELYET